MNRIATIGLAAIAITALGLASSTLAESQSTDPADAVSVDTDQLPVGDERKADIRTVVQDVHDQYTGDRTEPSSGGPGTSESSPARVDGGTSEQPDGSGADQANSDSAQRVGDRISETDWHSVLLGLSAVGLIGTITYYRQRIRRLMASRRPDDRPADSPTVAVQPDPETEIERAWVELLEHAGVSQPWTRTPQECARVVADTGYDQTIVDRLCRAFEAARYGADDPTSEHHKLARETLARLGAETE